MKMLWLIMALGLAAVLPNRDKEVTEQFDAKLFEAYEGGKHRRYTLLFSVNGGAFAVLKLVSERGIGNAGVLTAQQLAWGMFLFTTIMCYDILSFGRNMRSMSISASQNQRPPSIRHGMFALPGRLVLGLLWLLISIGWYVAGTAEVHPYCYPGAV